MMPSLHVSIRAEKGNQLPPAMHPEPSWESYHFLQHLVLECSAIQCLHSYQSLFAAPQNAAMLLFIWQENLIGASLSIYAS